MNKYDERSCNALEKPYYRALEAALRWCGLVEHEAAILEKVTDAVPSVGQFPEWPCLRVNAERILDAMENGDLSFGRDGKTVTPSEHVNRARRTVRHADLREWVARMYPDQKPAFLFGEAKSLVKTLAPRAETTYLNIIGALLDLLTKSPDGKRKPPYANKSAVISAIEERFPKIGGLSPRNLDDKLVQAERSLTTG